MIRGGHGVKGKILDYSSQDNAGVITGDDGNRYTFQQYDWKGEQLPVRGMSVDYETEGNMARQIYQSLGSAAGTGGKNKLAAGLLAIFLGGLGIHKFYLGFTGPGLLFLLVNTIGWVVTIFLLGIPNIILGVIALVEGIIYLTKTDEEFEQTYVIDKKKWF
ncbi:MAG TPA: TM2 domain-containing protein [Syntrophomonas sp.]|nr:TM2 domain-containing protein [Syntrophomonas sp.]